MKLIESIMFDNILGEGMDASSGPQNDADEGLSPLRQSVDWIDVNVFGWGWPLIFVIVGILLFILGEEEWFPKMVYLAFVGVAWKILYALWI
jgi:hypothetical protein